jgi:hypothetical protein
MDCYVSPLWNYHQPSESPTLSPQIKSELLSLMKVHLICQRALQALYEKWLELPNLKMYHVARQHAPLAELPNLMYVAHERALQAHAKESIKLAN